VVTTLADSGLGSLRAAITNANASSGVTITFAVTGTINLLGALPALTQSMTITGPGASSLVVDGGGAVQVFNVGTGITVTISGLTIQNGLGSASGGGGVANSGTLTLSSCLVAGNGIASGFGMGGAIYNLGTLAINQCTVSNNTAVGASGNGNGGGLYNGGPATITDSTFSANTAEGQGPGGGMGGAIFNNPSGTLTISGSTIAGNSVTAPSGADFGQGGAIYDAGTLTVKNSTISGNSQTGTSTDDFGGGIVVFFSGSAGTCTLTNTILAGNTDSGPSPDPDGSGTFTDGGNNLIGISTGIAGITNGVNGDRVGTSGAPLNPQLGALANNGGPTQTMLPFGNSPALGAGNPSGFLSTDTDQRGAGFLRLRNGVIDIGAVQLQGVALAATAGTPQSAGVGSTFGTALAATATESCGACASVVPGVTVTFMAPGSGPSGTFAGGVNTAVTNSSGLATAAAFTANMIAGGPYNVTASATTPDQAAPASANFSLTNTGSVSKPVLTVTANNASKIAGAPLPTFTATITGFVNGDTLAVVSGAASLTTTATALSPAGSYPIFAGLGTLSALNYTFTFVNGTLTVTAPPPPPPQPASINVVSGSGQSGAVGSAFAAPLVAVVIDQNGNVMSGAVVSFGVFSGSATLSATEVTTGLNGTAEITATPTAAGAIEILASVSGVSKVATFLETGSGPTAPAQLSVLPAALAFTAVEGGGNPLPASLAISNTGTGTLAWSASESSTPSWLTVSALSGATPAVVTASVNATGLKAGSYPGAITVTSGSQQKTVGVTLTVVPSTPQEFALTPAAVVVNASAGSTAPISRAIDIANGGTGTLSWTAAVNAGNAWLSVSPASGNSASGNVPSTLTVQLNPSGLAAGQYLGNIVLNTAALSGSGVPTANVTVVLNISALPDLISAVPLLEFRGPVGNSFAPQAIPVTTTTGAAVSLNASVSVTSGMNWLSISGAGGTTPGSISVSVNASGLAAGYYVGYISVQSSGAGNTLLVPVVLDLGSATAPGTLSATPGGVLFAGSTNSTGALSQSIAVSSDSGSLSWNAVALAGSNGTWLSVSPASGSGDGTFTVTANPAGLQPGSYTGQVAISATGTSNSELIIPVMLVVSSGSTPVTSTSTLQPVQPAGDFIADVGVPVAVQAFVFSSTGTPVIAATVQVAFTTGDSPVILTDVGGGNYVGVWTPLHAGPVSLLFTSPGLSTGVVTGVVTSTGIPAFSGAGVVNAAPMLSAAPLGVGSIATIFGLNLASHHVTATAFPLPLSLGGLAVTINGVPAPLFYASSTQINFFVPYELAGETTAAILVSTAVGVAAVTGVPITPESPGVFLTDAAGDAAVTHLNGQPVNAAAPAAAGEIVQIFATGLGPVSNAPTDDAAAPTKPLAMDQITPAVTIGGVNAKVVFAGLAPTFSGLNQIDVVVPAGLPSGPATVIIMVGPLASNTAVVQVQ
jgi:trimeric autotransporter adhesin